MFQKPNYWEMGPETWISCSYDTYEWCVKTILWYLPWSWRSYCLSGRGSGSSAQVYSEIFSRMRDIKFQPDMLQELFWAPWICIFTPNNFLFCHFALTWTLVCDLDSLENGTGEIHVVNISCMDEWSPLLSKWHEVLSIFIMQSLKHLRPCQKIFCKKIHTQTEQCCSTTPSWRSGRWRPSCSSCEPWWA